MPLPAHEPAGWDEPGHYYTVYLLALAAGFEELMAYRIAVYCQLPDQAIELDAGVAGTILARDKDFTTFVATNIPLVSRLSNNAVNADRSTLTDLRRLAEVQSGLHCFTGRPGDEETQIRRKIVEEMKPGAGTLVEYGLALHALGDSYAHRNRFNDMCGVPYGHAPSGACDEIGPDSAAMYDEYCHTLYELLAGAAKKLQLKARADLNNTILKSGLDTLKRRSWPKSEQFVYLRNTATNIGQSMRSEYKPDQDKLEPISTLRIADVLLGDYAYSRALACARNWAHVPPRPQRPHARPSFP